jgi:hypothetical protein
MNLPKAALLCALLLPCSLFASATDELQALRAENAQLRSRLQALQATCPASTKAPSASAALPVQGVTTPIVSAASSSQTPAAASTPAPPPGYRLIREPEPYTETGCSEGLFNSGPDALWKHQDAWSSLEKGMKPKEVESLLGIDHYNVSAGNKLQWQYGKCHDFVQGYVLFIDGVVRLWQTPDW